VSNVYQDLFGEVIFIGKAIYDVDAFERSLAGRVPENTLCSAITSLRAFMAAFCLATTFPSLPAGSMRPPLFWAAMRYLGKRIGLRWRPRSPGSCCAGTSNMQAGR
jgi:hypothetical protein